MSGFAPRLTRKPSDDDKPGIHAHQDNRVECTAQQPAGDWADADGPQTMARGAFYRMPAELLALIYEACAALEKPTYGYPFHDTSKLPWTLMRVCRNWREIVQYMPSLWTNVRVSVDILEASRHQPDDIAFILADYLKYSRPLPIALIILCEGTFPTYILPPLIETCDRWHSLLLFSHPDNFPLLEGLRGRMLVLQSLHVISARESSRLMPIPVMFELAPALSTVTLAGGALNLGFALPWAQICEFQADYVATIEVLPLLQLMPTLFHLKLDLEPTDTMWVDMRAWTVIHPGIRMLTMNVAGGHMHANDSMDCLTLPALRDLEVECPSIERVDSIRALLTRSGCVLDALSLVLKCDCIGELESLLELTPRLRKLTVLDQVPVTDASLLAALVVPGDNPENVLLPKLENIVLLARAAIAGESVDQWLDVFDSRVHPREVEEGADSGAMVRPLRRILMGHALPTDIVYNEVCARRFDRLRKEGVSAEIWYGTDIF